jgi:hypothetical protein
VFKTDLRTRGCALLTAANVEVTVLWLERQLLPPHCSQQQTLRLQCCGMLACAGETAAAPTLQTAGLTKTLEPIYGVTSHKMAFLFLYAKVHGVNPEQCKYMVHNTQEVLTFWMMDNVQKSCNSQKSVCLLSTLVQ